MWYIAKRELALFFSSIIGYMVIGLFLIGNSFLLWTFDNPYNILNSGFGDLNLFFDAVPWFLIFLIPALTMRTFSDEIRMGTIELILTKPISLFSIILGKFLGVLLLLLIALIPTILNLFAIQELLDHNSRMDWGVAFTSYLGLFLLSAVFISIGLCCSIKLKNQVAAFLVGVLLCYLQFDLWNQLAQLSQSPQLYEGLRNVGIKTHYVDISRGIISITDTLYFCGLSVFLLFCSVQFLKQLKQ